MANIHAYSKVVNFLDIKIDLRTGIFKPFMNVNYSPMYVNIQSNSPQEHSTGNQQQTQYNFMELPLPIRRPLLRVVITTPWHMNHLPTTLPKRNAERSKWLGLTNMRRLFATPWHCIPTHKPTAQTFYKTHCQTQLQLHAKHGKGSGKTQFGQEATKPNTCL